MRMRQNGKFASRWRRRIWEECNIRRELPCCPKTSSRAWNAPPTARCSYALGLTDEEIRKPLIGVVSSYNEIVPGHMNLDKIAEAVKAGVRAAGGHADSLPRDCRLRRDRPWGTSA